MTNKGIDSEQVASSGEDEAQVQADLSFVPGEDFVTERIRLSGNPNGKELQQYLELQVEASCPFPLDQVCWGAVVDRETEDALLYVSQAGNFDQDLPDVPTFLPFIGVASGDNSVVAAFHEKTLSLLVYEGGNLPAEVHSILVENDGDIETQVQNLMASLVSARGFELKGIYRLESIERNWKGVHQFVVTDDGGNRETIERTAKEIEIADIRAFDIKLAAKRESVIADVFWYSILGSAAGLIICVLAFTFQVIWKAQINGKEDLYASQQSLVAEIESRDRSATVLESGSAARLQPLLMLDLLNQVRPEGIFFTEVRASNGNQLEIEGMVEENGARLTQEYQALVMNHPKVRNASLDITRIAQGVTFFRVAVEFEELAVAEVGGLG